MVRVHFIHENYDTFFSFLRQDTDELRKQIFENVCFVFIDDTRRDKYVVGLSDIQKMHHIYHHLV